MITIYSQHEGKIVQRILGIDDTPLLKDALWVDLLNPSKAEEKLVENNLQIEIPTKKEMQEIEPSNRLYNENHTLFMTSTMVIKSETEPKTDAVTFILNKEKFLTVRYSEPHSFELFISRLSRATKCQFSPVQMMIGLLEATVDRLADILEKVSHHLDHSSQIIFHNDTSQTNVDYKKLLQDIGANGDLGAKIRESLVSFNRLIHYFKQTANSMMEGDILPRVEIISKDIDALSDHATFISNKVSFLLSASLGMVNIEQNDIIKIFSVAAVIFLPPTLIASIYGMNFKSMPELSWHLGYPIAICLMLLSAWIPYQFFKRKKWL